MRYATPTAMLVLALGLTGCGSDEEPAAAEQTASVFTVTSADLAADGTVAEEFVGSFPGYCEGGNRSVSLEWTGAPQGTAGFAVSMIDRSFAHWVVTGIDASSTGLPASDGGQVPANVGESLSGPGTYVGPCVTGNDYVYTVYALDEALAGDEQTTVDGLAALVEGHVLAEATLTARVAP